MIILRLYYNMIVLLKRQNMEILITYFGFMKINAHGIRKHVLQQPEVGILKSLNGHTKMVVCGMLIHVQRQSIAAISKF